MIEAETPSHTDQVLRQPAGYTASELEVARAKDKAEDERRAEERRKAHQAELKRREERAAKERAAIRKARETRRALVLKRSCEAALVGCTGKAEMLSPSEEVTIPLFEVRGLCLACARALFKA